MPDALDRLKAALADRYLIEREIGSGGMATVYLARDVKHERQVAVKVLRPELAAALGPERFLQEIKIAANLNHPHILPLCDSGDADGFLYYVMPRVEGESLRDRLDRDKQLPLDDAVRITREVADALAYAHSRGVIHRDIKPENILLESGHAMVADFGIARAVTEAGGEELTKTGIAIGTAMYMSPEQASGERDVDARSDIYSLGCVVYEMLVGEPPFTGPTPQAITARKLSEPVPAIGVVRDTVPTQLEQAIRTALAKVPADRFATAHQFADALVGVSIGEAVSSAPVSHLQRRVAVVTGVSVAIAVLGFLGWSSFRRAEPAIKVSNIRHVSHDPGLEFQPAISPDGKDVAYVVGPIGNPRIVVRSTIEVGSGGETRPGDEAGGSHWLPVWTPDGTSVRFLVCPLGFGSGCDWKEVGSRGGSVRSVGVRRVSSRTAWSRDGTRVAFAVGDSIFAYAADHGEP
jgi:serine/threonine-protein kinase